MELLVTISLSDKLFELLENKLPNLGRRVEKAITKELGAQVRQQSGIGITVVNDTPGTESEKPKQTRSAKTKADADSAEAAPAKTETAAENATAVTQPQEPRNLPEEIRMIMHRTRQRFEGEDYKENTATEAYQKHHKPLTNHFKQIALTLGSDKPSLLDTAEKVDAFAAECDALILDENGCVAPPPAPF
jgi:hypothetical protein